MKTKFKKGYYKAISFAIVLLMILLSLPTSYVYANEGETNDQMLSEKAQSESGDLSSTTAPDDLLPDGNDEKETEDEAKGVVPPPDVPQPTYLEDGVYAIKNVGNSTMYLDASDAAEPNITLQQRAYASSPTSVFADSALFKIKRVSGTRYIVRLMTNNCLTFGVSGNNIIGKELPYSDASVAASDCVSISETSTSGAFTISPYGSTQYLSAPNSSVSGGYVDESKILAVGSSSITSRAHWTFTKYTGAHKQDMVVIGSDSLIVGTTVTLRPVFYSTKIDYNMPVFDMQYANSSAFTLTGPTANGLYTIQIHQAQENMLVGLYVGNGSSRDRVRYDIWDLKLSIENGTYFFNNVELDETFMQIDDNESINQNGAQMELHEFDGQSYQKWNISHVSELYFVITSAASGKALTCPTSLDASVTQTTYTGANNQLWKFTRLSNGTYQITSKLNGRYLAAGAGMFTAIGRNIEARNAQSDGKDEWKVYKANGYEACFVSVQEPDHDHHSIFGTVMSDLTQLGYSDFNYIASNNISLTQVQNGLSTAKIFLSRSHGGSDSAGTYISLGTDYLGTAQIYNYTNNTRVLNLSNCDLLIFVACETAKHPTQSLPDAAVAAGATVAIGFENIIYCDEANEWVEKFFELYSNGGISVEDAANQAAQEFSSSSGIPSIRIAQ